MESERKLVPHDVDQRLREVQLLLARLSREKVEPYDSLGFFHARSVLLTRARELRAMKGR